MRATEWRLNPAWDQTLRKHKQSKQKSFGATFSPQNLK
jgi:hypothetical protein